MSRGLARLLQDPQVLHAAWQRVLDWYNETWPPEPEFAEWRLDPARHLRVLGESLARGDYRPAPFPLVPHPKKGMRLRHFCMPSVRDQVAFTVLGTLLAPLVEGGMPNFSFGNRIFRRPVRRWRSVDEAARFEAVGFPENAPGTKQKRIWDSLPFSLSDSKLYQPYRRAHGLFRRSIHWSAAALTRSRINKGKATDASLRPEDYPWNHIPPFANKGWWSTRSEQGSRLGYWARLDLQLAFPSADLKYLDGRLRVLLSRETQEKIKGTPRHEWAARFGRMSWDDAHRELPEDVKIALVEDPVRDALHDLLMRCLHEIRYVPFIVGEQQGRALADLWRPPHADQRLPLGDGQEHPGIPTGLAISGLLLNVYLNGLDEHLLDTAINARARGRPFAVFRFVDDIVLLAPRMDGLAMAIDEAWRGLAGAPSVLATRSSADIPTNLRVNWEKTEPKPMATLLERYLIDSWKQDLRCEGCKAVIPPALDGTGKSPKRTFRSWVKKQRKAIKDGAANVGLSEAFRGMKREAVRRNRLGPFVTYLVERLSALSDDGLPNRFGDGAKRRLIDLHELCRFDFDDRQVNSDTRLAFAASSLVRAWLSEDSLAGDREELREIRRSVRHAVLNAPGKYKLWRSVVRAAVRRPIGRSDVASAENDRKTARDWFRSMLRLLTSRSGGRTSELFLSQPSGDQVQALCWENSTGGGLTAEEVAMRSREISRLYCSFLRACVWRYVAETLVYLRRVGLSDEQEDAEGPVWTSRSWLFRAVPESELPVLADWLSQLDDWTAPEEEGAGSRLERWEAEALVLAVLAATPRQLLLDIARSGGSVKRAQPGPSTAELTLPDVPSVFKEKDRAREALRSVRRVLPAERYSDSRILLPLLSLASAEPGDEAALLKWIARSRGMLNGMAEEHVLAARLGVVGHVPSKQLALWSKEANAHLQDIPPALEKGPGAAYRWHERYKGLFEVALGPARVIKGKRPPTLYRVLWGDLWHTEPLGRAKIDPANAPRIGLPTRIALKLLLDAVGPLVDHWNPSRPMGAVPVVWTISERLQRFLAWGRRRQLLGRDAEAQLKVPRQQVWIEVSQDFASWEVLPHPAFFLPQSLGMKMSGPGYELWCHALLFLVACDGSERVLDSMSRFGAQPKALNEYWNYRNRVHLPESFWILLDGIVRQGMLAPSGFANVAQSLALELKRQMERLLTPAVTADDFRWERADVVLNDHVAQEAPRHISQFQPNRPTTIPRELRLRPAGLQEVLRVRIGQVAASPRWDGFPQRFPKGISRAEVQSIMREVTAALRVSETNGEPAGDSPGAVPARREGPELIVLPEATVPVGELSTLERFVARERRAVLCGEMFRTVERISPLPSRKNSARWIVNEASLIFPVINSEDSGPPLVRRFVIRKPMPTHMEYGLASALTELSKKSGDNTVWRMLAGQRWYRFVNPRWGDFTVAICSDLIDPSPWWSLRAQVLHIFMCAHNPDVELFESLSWVRAYENYCNLVSVNHGETGGSFAWTPRGGVSREVARLRGSNLLLVADIAIPVEPLHEMQVVGGQYALEKGAKGWLGKKLEKKSDYKSPPPTFPARR